MVVAKLLERKLFRSVRTQTEEKGQKIIIGRQQNFMNTEWMILDF
jgi:hypothetical protein